MNKINNRYLVIGFVVIVILSLCFGSGTMIDGGRNESGLISNDSWRWFPFIVTLFFGVLTGWFSFRGKNNKPRLNTTIFVKNKNDRRVDINQAT